MRDFLPVVQGRLVKFQDREFSSVGAYQQRQVLLFLA